jgi:hypothetical protein
MYDLLHLLDDSFLFLQYELLKSRHFSAYAIADTLIGIALRYRMLEDVLGLLSQFMQ